MPMKLSSPRDSVKCGNMCENVCNLWNDSMSNDSFDAACAGEGITKLQSERITYVTIGSRTATIRRQHINE